MPRGRPVTILDEGVSLTTNVAQIDFAGAGVTATNSGNNVTATISGSTGTAVTEEELTGTGTSFTLAQTPVSGTLKLYRGGSRQQLGANKDYTLSGTTITLIIAKVAEEILIADYNY